MSAVLPLLFASLGLAGIYFLLASGLSLVYGLMRVLNLAHGAVFATSAYIGYLVMASEISSDPWVRFWIAIAASSLTGAILGLFVERVLIARFYDRPMTQMLITLGMSFAVIAYLGGTFGHDPLRLALPSWFDAVTVIGDSRVQNARILIVAIALVAFLIIMFWLRRTTHGLIIRAGVENRRMVTALGIRVQRSFTLLFVIGSALAGLGGLLAAVFYGTVSPELGSAQLIFAFIVIIIGGLGSVEGTALSALLVATLQQFFNYYGPPGAGDIVVVLLLAVVLLTRPKGLLGKVTAE